MFIKSKYVKPQTASTLRISSMTHKKKSKIYNAKMWLLQNLSNYCNTTSLHGLNYITRNTISLKERLFWMGVIVLGIITTTSLVLVSIVWNSKTPTVTVIESTHYPTWNIPFPAVTICSFNLISKTRAFQVARRLQRPGNMSDEQVAHSFQALLFLADYKQNNEKEYIAFKEILIMNNLTIAELYSNIRPDCMEMIKHCRWKGSVKPCDFLFQHTSTTSSLCCAFNFYGFHTKSYPKKFLQQIPKHPYRITSCGYKTGLTVELATHAFDYFGTLFSSYGFRILIHDAYDFPDESAESKVITRNQETFLRILPKTTYATAAVKRLNVKNRKCLFSDESKLTAMERYSFINCLAECRNYLLYQKCGCIIPTLNREYQNSCTFEQYECLLANNDLFSRAQPNYTENFSIIKHTLTFPCNCIASCEENDYRTEVTTAYIKRITANRTFKKDNDNNDTCILHVFYGELLATRYRKDLLEDWITSLGNKQPTA